MGKFVSKDKIGVTDEANKHNVIYIKPKMGFGDRNLVIGEATSMGMPVKLIEQNDPSKMQANINFGLYNIALLKHNIVGWEGPDYDLVPCTHENIMLLDQEDPHVQKVLREINSRNVIKQGGASPNLSTKTGD